MILYETDYYLYTVLVIKSPSFCEIIRGQASQVHIIFFQYIFIFIKRFSAIINKKGQNKKIMVLLSYSVLLPERFFLRN